MRRLLVALTALMFLSGCSPAEQPQSGLPKAEIVTLAKTSFLGSFLSDGEKARHLKAVDAYAAARGIAEN